MEENKRYTIKDRLNRLFLSRHFLIFILVFFPIIWLLINKYIGEETFKFILIGLIWATLGTNSIDKFKDNIKIGK